MSNNIKSATAIIAEIRDGRAVLELSNEIHEAVRAVLQHGKPASVTLELKIAPLRKGAENLTEAPLVFTAEVSSKLPKPDPELTLFYVDDDENPSRMPGSRQTPLGLTVAGGGNNT